MCLMQWMAHGELYDWKDFPKHEEIWNLTSTACGITAQLADTAPDSEFAGAHSAPFTGFEGLGLQKAYD